ncbi:SDR family NAD(P)-dependent oxidoreductase [Guptibacillus hwajinpoensis]|uniref:NAD(P)-dependent dehydrogenase (Short-subunit alcohol dehydrogenase family) n=1 Tax=Guptibacillus hwajinpoensis TaxID=208199 RepID=A0ABU0K0W1_9BACL|nr:glucose 1-dehydrogenase [Alkalihalobacillus hemicentroti]MDQ0482992.1 NAD(P)-dependent dehydrogenase (short-subunit alcohol dehydrogenase family) [Alkalihalobacillus hemicentroti]
MSYLPSFELTDQVVVVTGAGKGIGRALAVGAAEAGADVVILARTEADINETAGLIRDLGRKAYPIQVDVTSNEDIINAVQRIKVEAGSIDVLINNAGMNIRSKAKDVTEAEWNQIFQTNLQGAFFMSQACAELMKENGRGKIINIASVAGLVALRTGVVYAATKAGMIQMTKNLALEWAEDNITVNAIGPWYFRTPLTDKLLQNEEYLQDILSRTPMKRVGELKDLVGASVFLSSEASNYMTGQTLYVDGGMTIYGF